MLEQLSLISPILSILIWLPMVGAVLVLCTGSDKHANMARTIAVIVALSNFLLCIPLYLAFDPSRYDMQFTEAHIWIPIYQIHYALGIDGLSLLMIILTNFTGLLVVIAGCHTISVRVAQYMAAFLTMQGMIVGVFCAMDAILFCVLGRHAYSYVSFHWDVGQYKSFLCINQILFIYFFGFYFNVGCFDLSA